VSRALVLNAGAGWAAYQVGALEVLVGERDLRFDHLVGCGIGAMNAGLVACGRLEELSRFWDSIGTWALVRPSARPWRAPMRNTPQRRFVERHVTEAALRARRVTLAVTTFDLVTGDEVVHRYPGDDVPLVDAVMAAVATPGLLPPLVHGRRLLAEATLIDSVPMAGLASGTEHVTAVLAGMPLVAGGRVRYRTWRSVLDRALEVNLGNDARRALDHMAESSTYHRDASALLDELAAIAEVAPVLDQLAADLGAGLRPPEVLAITPSEPLGYPLWRFPRGGMRRARELGRDDARLAVR
jgi:NTE family protein